MKKMNVLLKKCKSLSKLGRSSSYSSLRSKSNSYIQDWEGPANEDAKEAAVVFVGSSRRRYTISLKHLNHPLISALIDRSKINENHGDQKISVKCEVVLFDHLLWMLENADLDEVVADGALEELTQLYAC
ncbi:uncharacterized protein LOC109833081 [Asparagus officinalis]|uniref:uncharacterized protein LOC109833081 n=1 Tax=Asparagus officinalis TaxID=4686 RepID=UPI00098E1E60|nr:uncharacterized protein LOC109833081 [Asparagus officinalis]